MTDQEKLEKARELLGRVADLSPEWMGRSPNHGFFCRFCKGQGKTPPKIRHSHGCIVAQVQAFLNSFYD